MTVQWEVKAVHFALGICRTIRHVLVVLLKVSIVQSDESALTGVDRLPIFKAPAY